MTTALARVPATTYKRGPWIDRYGHKHPAITVKCRTPVDGKKRHKRRVARGKKGRYSPKVHSGWKKSQPAKTRRQLVLRAYKGDLLAAARSKQALANVTQDEETRVLALADAKYFFGQYHRERT